MAAAALTWLTWSAFQSAAFLWRNRLFSSPLSLAVSRRVLLRIRHTGPEPGTTLPKKGSAIAGLKGREPTITMNDFNYACTKCPRTFKLQEFYEKHKKVHELKKQHVCDICGFVYGAAKG